MRVEENEQGDETVVLTEGDSLAGIPESHANIMHPPIREAFNDPSGYFKNVANQTPFSSFASWLNKLIDDGDWELELNKGCGDSSMAGYYWDCEGVRGATIGLPLAPDLDWYPQSIQQFYEHVDAVLWNGFGCGGHLAGASDHLTLSCYNMDYHGADVELDETFIWGSSPCGDALIYTSDDRGGWLNHESHKIHLLGSIADTINWVFDRLLANESPEYDYAWN